MSDEASIAARYEARWLARQGLAATPEPPPTREEIGSAERAVARVLGEVMQNPDGDAAALGAGIMALPPRVQRIAHAGLKDAHDLLRQRAGGAPGA
jgi:hypothetical protein